MQRAEILKAIEDAKSKEDLDGLRKVVVEKVSKGTTWDREILKQWQMKYMCFRHCPLRSGEICPLCDTSPVPRRKEDTVIRRV